VPVTVNELVAVAARASDASSPTASASAGHTDRLIKVSLR